VQICESGQGTRAGSLCNETDKALRREFDRQVENLVRKGYHEIAGVAAEEFMRHIEPLKERVGEFAAYDREFKSGRIPFVIVIKNELVATAQAMTLVELGGTRGNVNTYPVDIDSFKSTASVDIPDRDAYLLVDIDTGQETLNVTPDNALNIILSAGRSPLTIDEGVALVTHFPEILTDKKKYNCFSLLASRRGDQRVPALWISYGKPRLGWCWAGNPHTWLGSASCARRVGP